MIGDRIRELRERRSWTQIHLADAAGVSLRTIQRLESVHSCSPETLLALAAALDVDVRELNDERLGPIDGAARLLWQGPDLRRAAWWGALITLPAFLFVTANLLKYGLGLAGPYDFFAAAGAVLGLENAFETASPIFLLGGPLAALALNLAALARPRIRSAPHAISLVGLELRLDPYGLAVMLIALGSLAALGLYLVVETLGHLARGVA